MSSTSRAAEEDPTHVSEDVNPPTYAAFAPPNLNYSTSNPQHRPTILVHQKSPLLIATPPQITRILAHSHPFLLPLNKIAALLTWTTGDPWQSFLLVAGFWFTTLYGDIVMRWAGPLVLVIGLILGMYARRYSPLSSTGWTGGKLPDNARRRDSEASTRHHKSLDEIVEELKLFTSRCNILLDPFLSLTDFLSTQRTATSATTRPALTTLFLRILLVTPFWFALTLPPFYIITSKRVILTFGTLILSWHSRPARVSRAILWRARTVRRICAAITGLSIGEPETGSPNGNAGGSKKPKSANEVAASLAAKRAHALPGIRFTFSLYENQRRWIGIGWTASMTAYERAAWTDEHLNRAVPKDQFQLPEVEGGHARWKWVGGSEWKVDGAEKTNGKGDSQSWIYYDNKWNNGRRGQDGWGRYTRRRKWYRDAELVEVDPSSSDATNPATPRPGSIREGSISDTEKLHAIDEFPANYTTAVDGAVDDSSSINNDGASSIRSKRRRWFRRHSRATSKGSVAGSSIGSSVDLRNGSAPANPDDDIVEDVHSPEQERGWGLGDDARMEFG